MGLIKKLRKSKKEAGPNEKPAMVKTHLRDMIIVPEMIGSVVGVYVSAIYLGCKGVFGTGQLDCNFTLLSTAASGRKRAGRMHE
jgi:hypothetical protein